MGSSRKLASSALVLILTFSAALTNPFASGSSGVKSFDAGFGQYKALGTPVKRVVGVGGAPFDSPDGTPYISASVNGSPAQFVSVNALTLEVDKIIEIPGTSSAPSMLSGADGNVYIGTTGTAELYRYKPGADKLELLGKPIAGETYIYGLANGPGGKIYGGTYPGGKLFEYDPVSGAFRNFGTIVQGEKYVRSLIYDEERGLFYVCTGTSNRLVEFDPDTGAVSANWMPESLAAEEYANSIDLIGGKLFIQLNKSSKLVVMDKMTKEIEYTRDGVSLEVIPSPDGTKAYFFTPGDAYAHAYDLATGKTEQLFRFGRYNGWKSVRLIQTGTAESPAFTLSAWAGYNAAVRYDFKTNQHRGQALDVPGQPIEIRSIGAGPDGRIYASGTQGGLGVYDPATGTMTQNLSGLSQAEGMASIGSILYFGIYPQARIGQFDISRPVGSGNPGEIARLAADSLQDRPFGMAGSSEHSKLFIGTVPQYGQLGGAFAVYDTKNGSLQTIRNLVQDHSIVTLLYKDGKVYGGTSIWGAYGAPAPVEKEGKLFVWDAASGQKVLEIVPVEGKQAVTSLIEGPDGKIWGFAEGVLFLFDPAAQTVTERHEVLPVKYNGTIWTDAFMATGKDGNVYATARGVFFRIDGLTKQAVILDSARQFSNLAQGSDGNLYMRSGLEGKRHELWTYTNPDLAFAWLKERVEALQASETIAEPLYKQLRSALRQASRHWEQDRLDQAAHFLDQAIFHVEKGEKWATAPARTELKAKLETLLGLIQAGQSPNSVSEP